MLRFFLHIDNKMQQPVKKDFRFIFSLVIRRVFWYTVFGELYSTDFVQEVAAFE